ncbi:DNA methyltransferase [Desulfobacterales bacterium HSG2]|nr:DNA methyltransferase [Desulfobacterales bacterium HSG2]
MGHFFSFDPESTVATGSDLKICGGYPPPVIPGRTEKMGHFFSSDPESTVATTDSDLSFSFDRNDMTLKFIEFKMKKFYTSDKKIALFNSDVMELYPEMPSPIVIISDGPYGIGGFPGDPPTPDELPLWYEPHIKEWSQISTPQTTLWFWNTEIGWAVVHPILKKNNWEYVSCHIWDKGIQHIAGNSNSKTLRKLPVVTEVCVQYVKKPIFTVDGATVEMKEWLRHEWKRSGLPFNTANEACGVKNAATRKYLTKCSLWYFPPADAFEKLSDYANTYGREGGKPYFSLDGVKTIKKEDWKKMRSKFKCPHGITNVWSEPPLNGEERIKIGSKAFHLNQKPLLFMNRTIQLSSDPGDLVFEPFGGLCSGVFAAHQIERKGMAAEINESVFDKAVERFKYVKTQLRLIQKVFG